MSSSITLHSLFFHTRSLKDAEGRYFGYTWQSVSYGDVTFSALPQKPGQEMHTPHIFFYRGANLNSGPHACATGTSHGTNPYSHTHKSEKCFQISVDIFSIFLHYEMNIRGGFPSLIHIQRTQCEKMHSERSLSQRQWSLQNCKLKTFPDTHTHKKNLQLLSGQRNSNIFFYSDTTKYSGMVCMIWNGMV